MIRELKNPIIQGMSRDNAPKDCFYCQFGNNIENSAILRVVVIEDNQKIWVFQNKDFPLSSNELKCPNSGFDD
jgi:hypothetical protein